MTQIMRISCSTKKCKFKITSFGKSQWKTVRPNSANTAQLDAAYKPATVEAKHRQSIVQCDLQAKDTTFRMLLPPPNITGHLHLGHALMAIIQDVICRRQRQLGAQTDWIPGTDHAGIATQVVVEKMLMKSKQMTKHQLGRSSFLQQLDVWKEEKTRSILADLRQLGCSMSWHKQYFTLDDTRNKAVNEAFVRLFDEGLITRRNDMVNWSCALESVISDIEVNNVQVQGASKFKVPGYAHDITFGRIYEIGYRFCNNSQEQIVVATTRPETLLGDVAVAVHPNDARYSCYKDRADLMLWHPFREECIPLIFDEMVDQQFGTGAVKITPAHDKADYEMAQRHQLPVIAVFTEQGKICSNFAQFAEMPRFVAREHILQALNEMHLLHCTREHNMSVPVCSRSNDIIEYMLRPQWFLSCQTLSQMALQAVQNGRLKIMPAQFVDEWQKWLENCRDWCISRQLWWGHRIPAYLLENAAGQQLWIAAHDAEQAQQKAQNQLQQPIIKCTQDTDVLDTWFSASLLPFSAHNWPAPAYKNNYPLNLLVTGHDILFFWVARMVMLGLQLTGEVPFAEVLMNGIVCDAHGRKMSKSLGNVLSPQQIIAGATSAQLQQTVQKSHNEGIISEMEMQKSIENLQILFPHGIPECGTDALRFTLCSHNVKQHKINFDVNECETNKLFFNKIWQASRFTLKASRLLKQTKTSALASYDLDQWDQWILSRLANSIRICELNFVAYNFHLITAALKDFLYGDLCNVYLETCKRHIHAGNENAATKVAVLSNCLNKALATMSPIAPFVAKELLQQLPAYSDAIKLEQNTAIETDIAHILEICQIVRQLKSRNSISKKYDPQLYLYASSAQALYKLQPHVEEIKTLTLTCGVQLSLPTDQFEIDKDLRFSSTAGHLCSFALKTNAKYQTETKSAAAYNQNKLQKLQKDLERYRTRYADEGFRRNASEKVQQQHEAKIKQLELEIIQIKSMIS